MGRILNSHCRGFTLAETMVSLTLLSLLMVAVLNLFPTSMTVVKQTRTGWLARSSAQNKLESLAAQPFATLQVGLEEVVEIKLSDGSLANLKTTVSAVDGHPEKFLKRLRCEVSWAGRVSRKSALLEVYVHSLRR